MLVPVSWSLTPFHRQTQRYLCSGHRQRESRLHFDTLCRLEIEGEREGQTHLQQRKTRERENCQQFLTPPQLLLKISVRCLDPPPPLSLLLPLTWSLAVVSHAKRLRASAALVCTKERGKEREETREGTAPAVISSERSDSEGSKGERMWVGGGGRSEV